MVKYGGKRDKQKKKRREDLREPNRSLEDIQKGIRNLVLYNHCVVFCLTKSAGAIEPSFSFPKEVAFLRKVVSEAGSERPFIIDIRESILNKKRAIICLE